MRVEREIYILYILLIQCVPTDDDELAVSFRLAKVLCDCDRSKGIINIQYIYLLPDQGESKPTTALYTQTKFHYISVHYQLQFIDCLTDLVQTRKPRLIVVDKKFGVIAIAKYTINTTLLIGLPKVIVELHRRQQINTIPIFIIIIIIPSIWFVIAGRGNALAFIFLIGTKDFLMIATIAIIGWRCFTSLNVTILFSFIYIDCVYIQMYIKDIDQVGTWKRLKL